MDQVVVVTGASSGAGRAIAAEFARKGATLILASRNLQALEVVANECLELGALRVLTVETDVTQDADHKTLVNRAAAFAGGIDVWVNNAGVLAAGSFEETPLEVHEQVIRTNLLGYIYGAYAVIPHFKKRGRGVLINNISVGGYLPVPMGSSYSASKFGLRGFFEALQGEMTAYPDIHICNAYPAFLDTPGIRHAANYTGSVLRPAPPVYNPETLAREVVQLAHNPRSSTVVGGITTLARFAHTLAPHLTMKLMFKVIRYYLDHADPAPNTSGNLFRPLRFGTSTHGGTSPLVKAGPVQLLMAGIGLLALLKIRKAWD